MNTDTTADDARKQSLEDLLKDKGFLYPGHCFAIDKMEPKRLLLLGPFPKSTINPTTSWRPEARAVLRRHKFKGTILSPELHGQDPTLDPEAWLEKYPPHATRFVVWIDCHSECTDERLFYILGELLTQEHTRKQLFIGWENQNLYHWFKIKLERRGIKVFDNLSSLCQAAALGTQ